MDLWQKGARTDLGPFERMDVSLTWTSPVVMELMAFYKTTDGRIGGVYSENYEGGTLGSLEQFPFIQLADYPGMAGALGDRREKMTIARIEDFEELYICAFNFASVSSESDTVFTDNHVKVNIMTTLGEAHTVVLDSPRSGCAAVICKLTGASVNELINASAVMDLDTLRNSIPGAGQIKVPSRVSLKSGSDHFVMKPVSSSGTLLINLNWNHTPHRKKAGFFSKLLGHDDAVDLDLGCLFELRTGHKGAIQSLGKNLGAFDRPPYIFHLGDDRSGAWAGGENLKVNLAHMSRLKRLLIFTYIYEGVADWASTDAVISLTIPGQPLLKVLLGSPTDTRPFCAIAMLEFGENLIHVVRQVSFHENQKDCDHVYGWGLRWAVARKD
jgi:uncharacterized protein involved in tellurium resistance